MKGSTYKFEDSRPYGGADRGVMTPHEKSVIATRRQAAAAEAAAKAEAEMQDAVTEILEDDTLTGPEKHRALGALSAQGYSDREWSILQDARDSITL